MAKSESLRITFVQDADEVAAMLDWLADSIDWDSEADYWGRKLHRLVGKSQNEQMSKRAAPAGP